MSDSKRSLLFLLLFTGAILLIFLVPLLYNQWSTEQTNLQNRYNGFDFVEHQEGKVTLWVTQIEVEGQTYNVPFYYHPAETESVVVEPGVFDRFFFEETQPDLIYLTLNPDSGSLPVVAAVEISRLTGERYNLLNIETRSALQFNNGGSVANIITCADATPETTVLFFESGSSNIIYRDQENPECLRLQYKELNESSRVADRFAFGLLQIMQ